MSDGDGFGLDKAARLKARREAEAEADRLEPLEPEFPWVCEATDPGFFEITAEPGPQALG